MGSLSTYYSVGQEHLNIIEGDYGQELFLTPFIKTDRIEEARKAARVKNLSPPSENKNSNVTLTNESYSGFLTVDEAKNSNLFFWFFPAQVFY